MKQPTIALALLASLALTTGCASIMGNQPEIVTITMEEPPSAEITIIGLNNSERFDHVGSQFQVTLSRSTDYMITVKAPDFEAEQYVLRRNIRGVFWCNLCIGGIPGFVVDYITNNMYEHDHTVVNVKLHPVRKGSNGEQAVVPVTLEDLRGNVVSVIEVPLTRRIPASR